MDKVLFKSSKIGIKKSPVHGWGVFALEDIEIGDMIEECPYIPVESYCNKTEPSDDKLTEYFFIYPNIFGEIKESNKKIKNMVPAIVLGYGSLYNHSFKPNVDYITNTELEIFEFISFKKIKNGEELFIKYSEEPMFMKKKK